MLEHEFNKLGIEYKTFREPGGTELSEKIRAILLDKENIELISTAESLLFAAARAQLTAEQIKPAIENGEFVINFVDESLVEQQNLCAIDFPPEIDEAEIAGITLEPSIAVQPKRIKQSPVAMECRRLVALELGPERIICIGEVLWIHALDGLIDPETYYVNEELYRPIGRIYGSLYVRLNDVFELPRVLTYEDWKEMGDAPQAKPVNWLQKGGQV